MTPRDFLDRPNALPWPPVILASAVAAAFVLGMVSPIAAWPAGSIAIRCFGVAVAVSGLGLDIAAMTEMRRRRANILPHRAATALVTTGPFSLSRNPIYLGNTMLVAGAAFVFANPWFLAAAPASAVAVEILAIRREEKHLAARFGEDWRAYANRTPRWIGLLPPWRAG